MSKSRNKTRVADDPAEKSRQDQPQGVDELAAMRQRIDELESAVAKAQEAKQRSLADFLNYQKRAMINERTAREDGASRVVESLLVVADYLDMALGQDADAVSAQAVMDGVRMIRQELHKVFCEYGVVAIDPAPGDELDPAKHAAMGHAPAEGVASGAISRLEQPGYEMAGRVLRPAKVYLAPPLETTNETDEDLSDADV